MRRNRQVDLAIMSNELFLAISNPSSQQLQEQVQRLTRQMIAVLEVVSGQNQMYLEPGYEEVRPEEGSHGQLPR